MAYTLSKYYRNILGLDLRISDLLRSQNAATEATNILLRQTGALSKRAGYQINTEIGTGSGGLIKYNNVAIGSGVITEELLGTDDTLRKYVEQTFTITYSGSDTAYYDLYLDPDTATFKFDMYDDNLQVLSLDLGTGEEATPVTITNLKTNVDLVTNFSMTISTAGTEPAAYSTIARAKNISATGTDNTYFTWTAIDTPGTYATPFSNHWATINNADFEIASFAQMLDVLYITNGYDDLHKYDGARVYKAGLPIPEDLTQSGSGAGGLSAGNYKWIYTYEHTDVKKNILESRNSEEFTYLAAGADSIDLDIPQLSISSGYGVAGARVNGAQAGVTTITVDSGHDVKVGDEIYVFDNVPGEVVKREVLAVTATTIQIDGGVITVLDNSPMSQIKITAWRTKVDGSIFYKEQDFANDRDVATVTYTSTAVDGILTIDKIDPVKIPGPPPKCRYIDVWRNQLVLTGDRDNLNTVYYSDFDGESFPLDQSFITEARLGGGNSGIKSLDNTLFIFKPRSVITCTGDLGTDTFQVDGMADDGVGCVANATIKELKGRLWFLGKQGIYSVDRSGTVKQSEMIEPKFDIPISEKRAVGHYWIEKDLYLVQFPVLLEDSGSDKYLDDTNSFIMVYDLYRQAWYEWNNINLLGGIAEYNGTLYCQGFSKDTSDSLSKQYTYKFLDTGTPDDYADHVSPIDFTYKSHWEALQEPSVFKKFLRIKVHSLDGTINDFETDKFSLDVTTEHDYRPVTISSLTMDFSGGVLGWGLTPWGLFNWGESRLEQLSSKLNSSKAKSLRTIFKNSEIHQNVLISGYEMEISTPYDLQIKE